MELLGSILVGLIGLAYGYYGYRRDKSRFWPKPPTAKPKPRKKPDIALYSPSRAYNPYRRSK